MLEVKHLNAFYGEAQALFDVSFSVPSGSLVLIHGLNGAGKSSLMKSIIGLLPNVQGHISWQGHALMNLPPYQRSEFGLGYVPEDRRIFTALTVRQNLEIQCQRARCETRRKRLLSMFKTFWICFLHWQACWSDLLPK